MQATAANTWSIATLDTSAGPVACIEVEGRTFALAPSLARVGGPAISDAMALFDDWAAMLPLLDKAAAAVDTADLVDGPRLAPLLYPGKILCAGANYYAHLREMGVTETAKEKQRLFFFFKPSKNAVVGEGETVHMPLDTEAFDWEVELAAVIGKRARAVSVEDALDHVAAYTVAIDLSARDLNRAPETFYKLDWVAGKAQETCCPMGPRLVPARAIADPQAVPLGLTVNGTTKQDDTTADMIFSIAEQIATASRLMTLDPGDVILTGTPSGVGVPRGEFLAVGDTVAATVAGIGTLSITVKPPLGS